MTAARLRKSRVKATHGCCDANTCIGFGGSARDANAGTPLERSATGVLTDSRNGADTADIQPPTAPALPARHSTSSDAHCSESTSHANAQASDSVTVTLAAVAAYLALAAVLCALVPSSERAQAAIHAPGRPDGYFAGFIAFTTFLLSEAAALLLHTDSSSRRVGAQTLAIAVCGTTSAAAHWLDYAPLWSPPGVGFVLVVAPLRHLTWCFTTGFFTYSTWLASNLSQGYLLISLALDTATISAGLLSAVTQGWIKAALYAAACGLFIGGVVRKWRLHGALLADCRGLHNTQEALRRLRWLSLIVWLLFPIVDLLQRTNLVGNFAAELLTVGSDVLAKCVLAGAVKQGIVSPSEQRTTLRRQAISVATLTQMRADQHRKEQAIATMALELKTPVNSIISTLDTLLETEKTLSDRCRNLLLSTSRTGTRLQTHIFALLDKADLGKDELILNKQPISIQPLVGEALALIGPSVPINTELRVSVPNDLPLAYGDSDHLLQVLLDLLGNAAKYTPAGHITVTAAVASNMLELSVVDTGVGIGDEDLEAIFEQPAQARQGHPARHGGYSGVGLPLARKIMEEHKGSLSVHALVGMGSNFTMRLPLYREGGQTGPAAAPRGPQGTSARKSGSRTSQEAELEPASSQAERHLGRRYRSDTALNLPNPFDRSFPSTEHKVGDLGLTTPEPQPTESEADPDPWPPLGTDTEMNAVLQRMRRVNSYGSLHKGDLAHPQDRSSRGPRGHPRRRPQPKHVTEILSVDDDPLNQQVICRLMAMNGFKVTFAMSGPEALGILERRFEQGGLDGFPDVILMDLMMPGMTGLEATKIIRSEYPSCNVPIIMVSAVNTEKEICEGLLEGCNDYVLKPYRHTELMARVGLQLRIVDFYRARLEAQQNERILQEILPWSVIDRLKQGQTAIADELPDVSVIFSDIVGFTELAATHTTPEIIGMLDELFTAFDDLVEQHQAYKVETIGDAYMIASGLEGQEDHAAVAINLAVDMIQAASHVTAPNGLPLVIRVGIHSGSAYAGVVGQKCPRYCLFGDTVNTASRMESNGFPMTVHMSDATMQRACAHSDMDEGRFYSMGRRPIKGKGMMQTWLLKEGNWRAAVRRHTVVMFDSCRNSSSLDVSRSSCDSSPCSSRSDASP